MITTILHGNSLSKSHHTFILRNIRFFSSLQSQVENTQQNETTCENFNYDHIRNEIIDHWMKSEAKSPRGSTIKSRYCCFTYHDAKQQYLKPNAHWHWLDKELSSNYAGETGAVYIYKGAMSAMSIRPNPKALEFCKTHMTNEQIHLSMFEKIIPKNKRTKLVPMWKMAGWTLGFVPMLIGGSKALYVTVESVETFVEEHFQEQIIPLKDTSCQELVKLLEYCCEDEVHHREDAKRHLLDGDEDLDSWWIQPWSFLVKTGSSIAAELARRY